MWSESWLHSAKSLKRKKKKDCEFINNVATYEINGLDQGPKKGLTDAAIMLCKLNKSL